jgi:trigger factor
VKLGVLVSKVLADAKLEVDQARVDAYIEDMASSYEDPTEVLNTSKMTNNNVLKSKQLC